MIHHKFSHVPVGVTRISTAEAVMYPSPKVGGVCLDAGLPWQFSCLQLLDAQGCSVNIIKKYIYNSYQLTTHNLFATIIDTTICPFQI